MIPSSLFAHRHCRSYCSGRTAGIARSSACLYYCPSTTLQIGRCNRRHDILSIISDVTTSRAILTPGQLKSSRVAKSP
jgi:hypothetical protein